MFSQAAKKQSNSYKNPPLKSKGNMATTKTNENKLNEILLAAIKTHVEAETNIEIDNAIKAATERIERRRKEILAATLLQVMKMVDFKTVEERITFTIREIPPTK